MNKKNTKLLFLKIFQGFSLVVALISLALIINHLWIQPYITNKKAQEISNLYDAEKSNNTILEEDIDIKTNDYIPPLRPQPPIIIDDEYIENLADREILAEFEELLEINSDIKAWISVAESNIDYPVVQASKNDPEFYLHRDLYKKPNRAGTLFLDRNSSVENNTRNFVVHGHNMTSSSNMFNHLIGYNKLDYYRQRPLISFNTIYEKSDWKIIALFKSNGSSDIEPLFDYTKSTFENDSDYLNFLYQIMLRSIFNYNVDVNEKDQILTLSTCSYEVNNYRTVIVARKIRPGEDKEVAVDSAIKKINPLYPKSWYNKFGGSPPKHYESFEEALENDRVPWYKQAQ